MNKAYNINLDLIRTAYTLDQLEVQTGPQVALAGRSNVGKSSLINALGSRKGLAKISATPGKTRSVNYYQVHPLDLFLVDLPGYGYARCSKEERNKWAKLMDTYFLRSKVIQGVVILLDCRLNPQNLDITLITYLRQRRVQIFPILTKSDKCSLLQRSKIQKQWQTLIESEDIPLCVSAKTGFNLDKLWEHIFQLAGVTPPDSTCKESTLEQTNKTNESKQGRRS